MSRRPLNLLRLAPAKEVEGDDPHACHDCCTTVPRAARCRWPSLALAAAPAAATARSDPKTLVVATHDSWAMSKEVLAKFKDETGITVKVQPQGDAGELTNKLVLTKDSPLADGVYGIDNTFASRAVDEGVLAPYDADGAARVGASSTGSPATDADQPDPDRLQRRVRQRRRHLVREEEAGAAEDARRPDRAGVQGPVRHARRDHVLARARLPARDDRRRGRRLAGLLEEADGQRRQGRPPAGPTPTRSTSPPVAATATGRS